MDILDDMGESKLSAKVFLKSELLLLTLALKALRSCISFTGVSIGLLCDEETL